MLERIPPKAKTYNPPVARVHGNTETWYERVGCKVHTKHLKSLKGAERTPQEKTERSSIRCVQ